MQETLKKTTAGSREPLEPSVTVCIRSTVSVLHGHWTWDMQSPAVYASDVMDFPTDFEGTKGIIHPEDVPNLDSALQLLADGELASLSFRLITTYGEVKAIHGQAISLEHPGAKKAATEKVLWEDSLQAFALRREAEVLQQRKSLADAAEKLYRMGCFAINKTTGEAWYSDGFFLVYGLPPQSLNAHANTFHPFLHPDDRIAFLDAFEAAFAAEVPVHLEYRIQVADSEPRTVRLVSYWSYNSKGQPIYTGVLRDLTEETEMAEQVSQAAEKMQLNQQVLKFAEQGWNTGYWFIDLLTHKVSYSENYCRIYGLKPQSMPTTNAFLNLVHPNDRPRVQELTENMYQQHQLPEAEFRIIRPDGRHRQIKQVGKLFTTGNTLLMVAIVQDVTVQRGLEKKVGELNEKLALQEALQSFTEGLTDTAFITWYAEGSQVWSEGIYRLLGYKPQSVEPSPRLVYRQIHPEDLKAFKDAEALAINGQPHEGLRFRIINRGGERQLHISFHRFGSTLQETVGVVRDLTREEAVQKKLVETAHYAEVVEATISDAIFLTDTENRVVSWNRAAEEKTGIKAADALYNNLFDLFPHLMDETYMAHLQAARRGDEVRELKVRDLYLRKVHHYYLTPLKNEKGEVQRVLHVVQDVSKELELQQQLSERLSFIESLVEASVDRIVVLDRHMNYLYWNKKAEDYYAISKQRVIGRNILEVFPGLRNDPDYGAFRRVLKGETVYLPPLPTNENTEYFETYLIPVKDERGEVTAILWIVHDLRNEWQLQEERRRIQAQLKEEHRRLKEAQAVGHVGSFTWMAGSTVSHWSDELYRINGLEPGSEEMTLEKVNQFIYPGDFAAVQALIEQSMGQPGNYGLIHRIVLRNGEVRWVNHQWESIAGEDGTVVRVTGIVQDITEQKKAEDRLKEQSHYLQRILDTGPDMVSIIEFATMKIHYLNEEAFVAHGFSTKYMAARSPEEIRGTIYADDKPLLEAFFQKFQTASDEDIITAEYRAKNSRGELNWFFVRGRVFQRDAEGRATHGLNVIEDITQRKMAEQEIRESRELLKTTIDSSLDMIQVFKAVRNEKEEIVDFVWLLNNEAAERAYGDVIGKSLLAENPGVVQETIFDTFKKVVETGIPDQSERHYRHEQFNDWFYQSTVKLGDGVATTTTNITERKNAEEEILRLKDAIAQQATDKYLTLFNAIDEGFYLAEVLFDENNQLVDVFYHEENPAAIRLLGGSVKGKKLTEVYPDHEQYWFDTYVGVALAGESVRLEQFAQRYNKWFNFYVTRIGGENSRQIAIVFEDITERKRAQEKQQFLLKLTDALRPLSDPVEVQEVVTRLARHHFGADRCYYCEIDGENAIIRRDASAEGLPSVAGVYPLNTMPVFKAVLDAGSSVVVPDAHTTELMDENLRQLCIQLGVISYIDVPVIKNGQPAGVLCIAQSAPRTWTNTETNLANEIAERTWEAVQRARAEEALRESEEHFRSLMTATSNRVYKMSADWKLMYNLVGKNFLADTGNADSSWIEKYIPEEERASVLKAIAEAIRNKMVFDMEHRVFDAAGNLAWVHFRATPMLNEQGEIVEWIGAGSDITERKQAEEQLQHFNERLEQLVAQRTAALQQTTAELQKNMAILRHTEELAQIGSWEYDLATGNFNWSKGMYQLFGLETGVVLRPEIYLDFAIDEDRSIAKRIVKCLKKAHQPIDETMRIRRGTEQRLLRIKASVVTDEVGRPQRMVGVDWDITDIHAAQATAKENQRWLEQMALASPDAITIYDLAQQQPVYLNQCMANWLGLTNEELIRLGIDGRLQLVYADDRLRLLHFNEKLKMANDSDLLTLEYRIRRWDDSLIWLRNRSKVFQRDAKGKVTHVLSVLQDVTEARAAERVLKTLNASLEKKNQELESANEEITSFAFVASHDLKEPLRKIHTFSNLLLTSETHLSESGRQTLEKLNSSVKRLNLLINDILTLTKVHVDNEKLVPVDLNSLLEKLKNEMQDKWKHVVIDAAPLPTILGAENQLFYLLKNLIGNGIKFQAKGNVPNITIRAATEGACQKITVSDNGIGIDPDYHKKIFEMFRRLHSRTEYEGTGMGLAICKKIMEKHGGKITVESTPGQGASFTCWFPLALSTT